MLLRRVEVGGRRRDVRVRDGRVTEVGDDLATDDAEVIDGDGGALLPGLHDHHLHLMALAAARSSVDCSSRAGLESLATARGTWARGVDYHESVAGPRIGMPWITWSAPDRRESSTAPGPCGSSTRLDCSNCAARWISRPTSNGMRPAYRPVVCGGTTPG